MYPEFLGHYFVPQQKGPHLQLALDLLLPGVERSRVILSSPEPGRGIETLRLAGKNTWKVRFTTNWFHVYIETLRMGDLYILAICLLEHIWYPHEPTQFRLSTLKKGNKIKLTSGKKSSVLAFPQNESPDSRKTANGKAYHLPPPLQKK